MKKVLQSLVLMFVLVAFGGCLSESQDENNERVNLKNDVVRVGEVGEITVYYKANIEWLSSSSQINMHYNDGNGWTSVPGVGMVKESQYSEYNGYASKTVAANSLTVCFNRDGSEWDSNGGQNYTISGTGVYKVENGQVIEVEDNVNVGINIEISGNGSSVVGEEAKVYKDGEFYQVAGINPAPHNAVMVLLSELGTGSYSVEIDSVKDGYKYEGSYDFTVNSNSDSLLFGNLYVEKEEVVTEFITVYYKNVNWVASPGIVNMHYNDGNGWTVAPGEAMEKHTSQYDEWLNYASITVEANSLTVCFNQNGSNWDSNNGANYSITGAGTYKIENGNVIELTDTTSVDGDIYVTYDHSIQLDLNGLTMTLTKDGVDYKTELVEDHFSHGVYARFLDLPVGEYVAKIDEEQNNYRLAGTDTFAIESGDTYFSATVELTIGTGTAVDGDVYVTHDHSLQVNVDGLTMVLTKDGVEYETALVEDHFSHGVYARFLDLPAGSYVANINEVKDGYKFIGTDTFELAIGATYFSAGITLLIEDATAADGDVYAGIDYSNFTSYEVGGLIVDLYKNGEKVTEGEMGVHGSHGTYARFLDLKAGTYVAKIDEVRDGNHYMAEGTVVVEFGDVNFSSITIEITKEAVLNTITVYYKNVNWVASPGTVNMHYDDGSGWTVAPGLEMEKHTSQYDEWLNYASITVEATSLTFCFNQNGSNWDSNNGSDYTVSGVGVYTVDSGVVTKID